LKPETACGSFFFWTVRRQVPTIPPTGAGLMRTDRIAAERMLVNADPWMAWIAVLVWLTVVSCTSLVSEPPGSKWLIALSHHFASPGRALRVMQAILHVGLFGVGSVAVASAIATTPLFSSRRKLFLLTLMFVMIFGIAIEILQDYVPRRRADLIDLLGDLVGAVFSLGFVWAAGLRPFARKPRV